MESDRDARRLDKEPFIGLLMGFPPAIGVRTVRHYIAAHSFSNAEDCRSTKSLVATWLAEFFERIGELEYIEEAIRLGQECVAACPPGHDARAKMLSNLASYYAMRGDKNGALSDLEKSLELSQTAIDCTESSVSHEHLAFSALAVSNFKLYSRTSSIAYLSQALQAAQQAVGLAPPDADQRALLTANLGHFFHSMYLESADMKELDRAIELKQEALDWFPLDDERRNTCLSSLSHSLLVRQSTRGTTEDIKRAIIASQEAVDRSWAQHPRRSQYLVELGNFHRLLHNFSGNMGHHESAIAHFQAALSHGFSNLRSRIHAGRLLATCQVATGNYQAACKASSTAIRLIPLLTPKSLAHSDIQHEVGQFTGLASQGASIALLAEEGVFSAIEMLEIGRSVLIGSLSEIRTEDTKLRLKNEELAKKYVRLRNSLESSSDPDGLPQDVSNASSLSTEWEDRGEAHRKLEALLIEIRNQPGLEDFMLPPTRTRIMKAAEAGPIVYINSSFYRCDAILIESHQLRVLNLPLLDVTDSESMQKKFSLGLPALLSWLWDTVAEPILDALGFTQHPPQGEQWPSVWWIPTGVLSKFPIHAAGRHVESSYRSVMDRVISSYSTTINAILTGQDEALFQTPVPNKALLVAMPSTPSRKPLKFATEEVQMLRELCQSIDLESIEPQPQPRKSNVLDQLMTCQLFHFAGHAASSDHNPLESALLLEDWKTDPLTVQDLFQTNVQLRSPFLAFLSACGTGRIKDKRYIDEGVHLISACQLAGFRHVIGTLWEIQDEGCVEMARCIYENIIKEGMTDFSVRFALHQACRAFRDKWLGSLNEDQSHEGLNSSYQDVATMSEESTHSETKSLRHADLDGDDASERITSRALLHWIPYVHFGA